MSITNIVDFVTRKRADASETEFLQFIDADIDCNPDAIRPMPSSLLARMSRLIERAEAADHSELLEG